MPTLHLTSRKVNRLIFCYLSIFIFIYFVLGLVIYSEIRDYRLHFYVFDVGQGDALLVRTPSHQNIVIDGGASNQIVYKLGKYLPVYDRKIDLIILTHPHADHITGLLEVIERYDVGAVMTSSLAHQSAQVIAWQSLVQQKNIKTIFIDRPIVLSIDHEVDLYILSPLNSSLNKNINNSSIVAKLVYGQSSLLLTGDFEKEEELAKIWLDLSADVLKVGHHGADNANSLAFLKQVKPKFAVISVGADNRFGHPNQKTLLNLSNLRAEIFRTDLLGDIHFTSQGEFFERRP